MRIPFSWLQEFVKIDLAPEDLCKELIMIGFADAEVLPTEWGMLDLFVAGRVTGIRAHPRDAHLKVADVNVGYSSLVSVCGAPVVEVGELYAVALPGARLGTGRAVEAAPVDGVMSQCVLCSGREAWLDDSRDELLSLPRETAPGARMIEVLGLDEAVIEMEVTPNRGDCLGLIGVARELAAVFAKELMIPEPGLIENGDRVDRLVSVEVVDKEACPRYGAMVCEDVAVRPSPARTRARLRLAGLRPINNVVDAANLVLFETGHPLHAFDLDKLAGSRILVRPARAGEKIAAIDGHTYELGPTDLVIADAEKAVAIAGVIGGEYSSVGPSTQRVLIEGAVFDHCVVWRTSRRLGLSTEASYRFERSVDIGAIKYVLARAGSLIQAETRCMVARGVIDVYSRPAECRHLTVSPKRVNRLLGTSIPEQELCDYLERLGFVVSPGKTLEIVVPARRGDVGSEADIAEEVARMYGYERIGEATARSCSAYGRVSPRARLFQAVKHSLTGMGLFEAVTDSMIAPVDIDLFRMDAAEAIKVSNPVSHQNSVLRPSLVPGMVRALVRNELNGQESIALFELGKVYLSNDGEPLEPYRLAIGLSGVKQLRAWHGRARDFDFYDLKGIVESLMGWLGLAAAFEEGDREILHAGRRAAVVAELGGKQTKVGFLGEISPGISEAADSRRRMCLCELDFERLVEPSLVRRGFHAVPKYPAVKRDIAVVVPLAVKDSQIREAILAEGRPLIKSAEVFDVYTGEQIPRGTRSLAYGLVFASDERTLTEEEVDAVQKRIEEAISRQYGAKLRAKE